MVNFGLLAAEIDPVVWGTPANFNGIRVLVVGVSQTLRRWTEGARATYVWVKVLRFTRHEMGHVGDILPASPWA